MVSILCYKFDLSLTIAEEWIILQKAGVQQKHGVFIATKCNIFSQSNIILTLDSKQPYIVMYWRHRKCLDCNMYKGGWIEKEEIVKGLKAATYSSLSINFFWWCKRVRLGPRLKVWRRKFNLSKLLKRKQKETGHKPCIAQIKELTVYRLKILRTILIYFISTVNCIDVFVRYVLSSL